MFCNPPFPQASIPYCRRVFRASGSSMAPVCLPCLVVQQQPYLLGESQTSSPTFRTAQPLSMCHQRPQHTAVQWQSSGSPVAWSGFPQARVIHRRHSPGQMPGRLQDSLQYPLRQRSLKPLSFFSPCHILPPFLYSVFQQRLTEFG